MISIEQSYKKQWATHENSSKLINLHLNSFSSCMINISISIIEEENARGEKKMTHTQNANNKDKNFTKLHGGCLVFFKVQYPL